MTISRRQATRRIECSSGANRRMLNGTGFAPKGLGLLGTATRLVASRVGLMWRLALAVDPRLAGPLAGCSRHAPSARIAPPLGAAKQRSCERGGRTLQRP